MSQQLRQIILREREQRTSILGLLRKKMEAVDHGRRRRRRVRKKSFKERLGLKTIACCGGTWDLTARNEELDDQVHSQVPQQQEMTCARQSPHGMSSWDAACMTHASPSGMNLAAALAAERHLRRATLEPGESNLDGTISAPPGTPLKVSLLRLLEETDCRDGEDSCGGGEVANETMCCVCTGRKKGAAFIPCGHTFCRVCSRELWLNRGSCPLCNRSILEILDIF